MIADGRKEILNLAVVCSRVANAVGGDQRQIQRVRDADRSLISPFLLAFLMALQFDVDIFAPEEIDQLLDCFASFFFAAAGQCCRQRTFVSSG